jgi:L-proline---[L-prolyl-carrier protein] ligase
MAYLLWHYLAESAKKYPSRPAVAWRGTVLSYRELDEQSDRLARFLVSHGISRGTRVALYLPKSIEAVVSMVGILKAGAAYVPIDPNAPARRAAFILHDCAVSALITTGEKLARLSEFFLQPRPKVVLLTENESRSLSHEAEASVHHWKELASENSSQIERIDGVEGDPAYLLYTSGSTGTPKGVVLSHRNAMTFVEWGVETFAPQPSDRLTNHAPLHFDLSVFDIYAAFCSGACVVLVPDEVAAFPMELARWIEAEEISIMYAVPSAFVRLLLHGKLERFEYRKLRTVLFAGEVFPVKYLREVMARLKYAEFSNLYGPTETNVCTYFRVPPAFNFETPSISIGRACANVEVFAVNEKNEVVAEGESGELYVRGPTVMLGYWGLPEKTGQVLLHNPFQFAYQERVYRTGDLVRLEADGNWTFLGRKDHMVKSRGYRIELGEIEQVLYQHQQVREVAVLAIPDEEIGSRLQAAVVPQGKTDLTPADLQSFCHTRLPKYMVPESFVFVSEIPKTSTGKTDRLALSTTLELSSSEVARS